jgi:hypothetical protein
MAAIAAGANAAVMKMSVVRMIVLNVCSVITGHVGESERRHAAMTRLRIRFSAASTSQCRV